MHEQTDNYLIWRSNLQAICLSLVSFIFTAGTKYLLYFFINVTCDGLLDGLNAVKSWLHVKSWS